MDTKDQILAVYAVDVVNASQKGGINFSKIKDIFWDIIQNIPSYNIALKRGLLMDLGDGGYVATDISHLSDLLTLAKELSIKLDEYNKSQSDKELHITVRQGIHVGHCKVKYSGEKIVQTSGSGIVYATRVMNLDTDGGHILLTNSARAAILSQTTLYRDDLHYQGKYPIKHGQFLRVWDYYHVSLGTKETSFGNTETLTKKNAPAILNINKKNQILGITLIAVTFVATIFGGAIFAQFYDDVNLSDIEKTQIESDLRNKVLNLIDIQKATVEEIESEFRDTTLDNTGHLNLTPSQRNTIQSILNTVALHPEIEYGILSNPPPSCGILLYTEPYYEEFDKKINFTGYERCLGMQTYTIYLTSTYYATGPQKFVDSLVTRVYNDPQNDKSTVANMIIAITWSPIINEIRQTIPLEDVRMILVDHKESIVIDCHNQNCKEFEENAIQRMAPSFDDSYLPNEGYEIITIPIEEIEIDFENQHVMKDWILYVVYPQLPLLSSYILQLSALIAPLIVLGLLIYYYLIPRNWLDDDISKSDDFN